MPSSSAVLCFGVSTLAFAVFSNSLHGDFVYDDSRAVVTNRDVVGPFEGLGAMLSHDYWGGPLGHSGSHLSWRPLTTLSFRANFLTTALSTLPFHLVNAALHALVTGLVFRLAREELGLRWRAAGLSAALFAVHPVHCEAVAGVVGRAELLCAAFLLACVWSLERLAETGRVGWALAALVSALLSLLSKETGLTALPVAACLVLLQAPARRKTRPGLPACLLVSAVGSSSLLLLRLWVVGFRRPVFSASDNPAAAAHEPFVRLASLAALPLRHAGLLLCPASLSFDWSMDAVPLVASPADGLFLASLAFYALLCRCATLALDRWTTLLPIDPSRPLPGRLLLALRLGLAGAEPKTPLQSRSPSPDLNGNVASALDANNNAATKCSTCSAKPGYRLKFAGKKLGLPNGDEAPSQRLIEAEAVLFAAALAVLTFLPASNLLAYVGFVLAERVLYLPSVGFCILIGMGLDRLLRDPSARVFGQVATATILVSLSAKTLLRNGDWASEERLYRSGIPVNPAKAWSNLGNVLFNQQRLAEAEEAYRAALGHRPNMADSHYNLGTLLHTSKRHSEAVASYETALKCRPRFALAHLNLGLAQSALGQRAEAKATFTACASATSEGFKDPLGHDNAAAGCLYNLGRLAADDGAHQDAIAAYQAALARAKAGFASRHSVLNMLGESLGKTGLGEEAEELFREALRLKPDHLPAHLTLAHRLHQKGQLDAAGELFQRAVALEPGNSAAWRHLGDFQSQTGQLREAAESLGKAARLRPSDAELRIQLGHALRSAGRQDDALAEYREATRLSPSLASAWANLGAALHLAGHVAKAEEAYEKAIGLDSRDKLSRQNLDKLRRLKAKGGK